METEIIKTKGTSCRTKVSTRFASERIMMSHFSFLKTPVFILLKNKMPSRTETAVGTQMPRMFRTNEGCSIAFIKISDREKTKTAAEYARTILRIRDAGLTWIKSSEKLTMP